MESTKIILVKNEKSVQKNCGQRTIRKVEKMMKKFFEGIEGIIKQIKTQRSTEQLKEGNALK